MSEPLDRLRWNLTYWYVCTFGAILLAFGVGLFVAIRRNIDVKLDRSLARAADEVIQIPAPGGPGRPTRADIVAGLRLVRIPDRALYLLDAAGTPIYPDTASAAVRGAARRAASSAPAWSAADIGHEHTLRVYAVRYVAAGGDTLVAAAAADSEELEDEFARLITLFAGAMAAALVLVGVGGYALARRSTRPVEQSFGHMRRFMADAAHELRTPVSFLRAHAEVALQQPREAAEYEQTVRDMGHEADHLSAIVNDLFTLARADAGERRLQPEHFYLDDIVLEGATDIRTSATLAGVHVDVSDFEEAPVEADLALVRQLIRILLDNALKYTPRGGRVTLGVGMRAGRATAVISDTGIGIAPEDIPRVHERFFRSDAARRHGNGAGMGLSIAHWIVDLHDASMTIASQPAKGTRVEIAFHAARALGDTAAHAADGVIVA
jgi:signal transduction histidine kinase